MSVINDITITHGEFEGKHRVSCTAGKYTLVTVTADGVKCTPLEELQQEFVRELYFGRGTPHDCKQAILAHWDTL